MTSITFNASPARNTGLPVLAVAASVYFNTLNSLILKCEVTTLRGAKIFLEDGFRQALGIIAEAKERDRKIMLIGNGGSAAIASHEALDFWKAGGIKATAFNDPAQLTCLGNDFGYEQIFARAIDVFGDRGDLLMAISSSGKSPSILNGVASARNRQCSVITFAGFTQDNPLRALGDLNFYIGSSSYGHVEVAHLALIHYLADMMGIDRRGGSK